MFKVKKAVREEIFGDDREFDSPHAPTVLPLKNNDVLAAWFGGRFEKDPDTAIWTAKRLNGVWQKPKKTVDVMNIAAWNPVLFRLNNDRIILYFKLGPEIPKWHTEYVYSDDEGKTWSSPKELVKGDIGGRGPVKNKTFCFGKGIIQPTIWEDDENIVHMLFRSTSSRIFKSDSYDMGRTWNLAYDTGLPNNNSGIDAVKLPNGTLVLAYNPRENIPGMTKGARTPIILSYSDDNGSSWKELYILENCDGAFAYPSIVCDGNDKIYVVYSENREKIIFWNIEYEETVN